MRTDTRADNARAGSTGAKKLGKIAVHESMRVLRDR